MVAREGRLPVSVLAGLALACVGFLGVAWSVPLWMLLAGAVWLYFEPRATTVAQPTAAVAPLSGIVTRVDDVHDPWLDRTSRRVRIVSEFPGVGALLAPTEGKVVDYQVGDKAFDIGPRRKGESRLAIFSAFASSPNCYALHVRAEGDDELIVAASSVRPVSRVRLTTCPGERVSQGRKFAFAYFVDMVDVLVPSRASVAVSKGQRVTAGEPVLTGLVANDHSSETHVPARTS